VLAGEAWAYLDEVIPDGVRARGGGKDLATGWMLVASVKHHRLLTADEYTVNPGSGTPTVATGVFRGKVVGEVEQGVNRHLCADAGE
jgi:hypothetical protein